MNLFLLDASPVMCAAYHCDKHVVKMVLETAQILCSAHWLCDEDIGPGWYRPTHLHHPIVQWAAHEALAYDFTYVMFKALAAEYEYRYGREHLSWTKFGDILNVRPHYIPERESVVNWFPLCMPPQYWPTGKQNVSLATAVKAYRAYYRGEKQRMFQWTGRGIPRWIAS